MFASLKTFALSAMIGAGALSAVPAQADSLYLNFGAGGSSAGVIIGDSQRWDRHDRDRGNWDRDEWNRRDRHESRRCSPERAASKAERMGIRHVRVIDVDRRTITVRGRSRGDRVIVTFARTPNCPVIG